MATLMNFLVNYVNAAIKYETTPGDYILVDLANDYLIWSRNLADLMTHQPTSDELNAAAEIIDPSLPITVTECLLMDYSHTIGGYYTHKIKKDVSGEDNQQYVFCFSFDGATATEPQLEAWDDSGHTTFIKNVLGLGTALNSFIKGKCTTLISPGHGWVGTALAGASNVLLLNNGNGALPVLGSGITSQELYCNLKTVIPANYSTPAAESYVLTCRYTYF